MIFIDPWVVHGGMAERLYLEPPPPTFERRLSSHRPPPIQLPCADDNRVLFSVIIKPDGQDVPPAPGRRRGKATWVIGRSPRDESTPPMSPSRPASWGRFIIMWATALCGGTAAGAAPAAPRTRTRRPFRVCF